MQGPLRMVLRLPLVSHVPLAMIPSPISISTASPTATPQTDHVITTAVPVVDSGAPQKERRHSPRTPTTLPATITFGSSTWSGTVSNISLGGTCITLPGNFPIFPPQDAYLVLKTAVGILELHGETQERAIWPLSGTPISKLIVVFDLPKQEEAAVLASLIQAA